jgi:DNA-binding CsgD family transcriptional regulator
MSAIPPARRQIPATFTELQAEMDALGFTNEWFRRNVPPLAPAQLRAELNRIAPPPRRSPALQNLPKCYTHDRPSIPAKQTHASPPALHNLPECSAPHLDPISAERTQPPAPPASTPSDPGNVPQSSTERSDANFAERTHRFPTAFQFVSPSADLTPRQERAARLLAAGHTATAAAALLGVERHTIHRYKRLVPFNDQVRRLLAAL